MNDIKWMLEGYMEDTAAFVGHVGFTWGAYLMSNWTEIGAACLMLLQGTLLILKIVSWFRKDKFKRRSDDE